MVVLGLAYLCLVYVLPTKYNKQHQRKNNKITPDPNDDETNERLQGTDFAWQDPELNAATGLADPLPEIPEGIAMASDLKTLEYKIKQQYLNALNKNSEGEVAALIADDDGADVRDFKKGLKEASIDFEFSSAIYAAANAVERRRLLGSAGAKIQAEQNLDSALRNRLFATLKAMGEKEDDCDATIQALKDTLDTQGIAFDAGGIYAAAEAAERKRLLAETRKTLLEVKQQSTDSKLQNQLAAKMKGMEEKEGGKAAMAAMMAAEGDLNEAVAALFAAKLFADFDDFVPPATIGGRAGLDSAFALQLYDLGGHALVDGIQKKMNGDPGGAEALELATGQTLAQIEREAITHQLVLSHEKRGKAASLQADFRNRLARRMKAVHLEHALVLAETTIVAPSALPLPNVAAAELDTPEVERAKLGLEAAFKKAYLEGLRHQLGSDSLRNAAAGKTINNSLQIPAKSAAKVLEEQLAGNKAAVFAERFVNVQRDLKGFVAGFEIPGLGAAGTSKSSDQDYAPAPSMRKGQIEKQRARIAMDLETLQQRSDLDSKLKIRLATQLYAAEARLDASDVDYAVQIRTAKMVHLRQQLQLQRSRLAACNNLDATLRNQLTARLNVAEKTLDDDDLHFNEGVLAEANLDALLKRMNFLSQALAEIEDGDDGVHSAQRDAAKDRLTHVKEKYGAANFEHQTYLKQARAAALQHQLALDRALLDGSTNLNSTLKGRLADELMSADGMLLSATDIGCSKSAKQSYTLSQQLSDKNMAAEEVYAALSAEFISALATMIADTKRKLDDSIDKSSADASEAAQKKVQLAELRKQLLSGRQHLKRTKKTDMALKERLIDQIKKAETEEAHISAGVGAGQITKQFNDLQALLGRREGNSDLQLGLQLEDESSDMFDAENAVFEHYRCDLMAALAAAKSVPADADEPGKAAMIRNLEVLVEEANLEAERPAQSGTAVHSLPLERALAAAFDEGWKQRGAIDESETGAQHKKARLAGLRKRLEDNRKKLENSNNTHMGVALNQRLVTEIKDTEVEEKKASVEAAENAGALAMQQKLVAEAKVDLAFESPSAAVRVAQEATETAEAAGLFRPAASTTAFSEKDAKAFKLKIKASYFEGLKTEGDDESEMETRLRKSRVAVLRKKLQDDRGQLERAASTNLALKDKLCAQIKKNEEMEGEESAVIQLEEVKMDIASDKADEFAAKFIEVYDVTSLSIVVGVVPHEDVSPVLPVPGVEGKAPREVAAEEAATARAKHLNHAIHSAMKVAFQQGIRQTLAWKREESAQLQTNRSKVRGRLAARLAAAEKSRIYIAKNEKERKANAAAQEALKHARKKKLLPSTLPTSGSGPRALIQAAVQKPAKTSLMPKKLKEMALRRMPVAQSSDPFQRPKPPKGPGATPPRPRSGRRSAMRQWSSGQPKAGDPNCGAHGSAESGSSLSRVNKHFSLQRQHHKLQFSSRGASAGPTGRPMTMPPRSTGGQGKRPGSADTSLGSLTSDPFARWQLPIQSQRQSSGPTAAAAQWGRLKRKSLKIDAYANTPDGLAKPKLGAVRGIPTKTVSSSGLAKLASSPFGTTSGVGKL